MSEYINFELSGTDKGYDQLTKRQYLQTTTSTNTTTETTASAVRTTQAENFEMNI